MQSDSLLENVVVTLLKCGIDAFRDPRIGRGVVSLPLDRGHDQIEQYRARNIRGQVATVAVIHGRSKHVGRRPDAETIFPGEVALHLAH
jgi:hypothetical protein